MFCLTDIVDLRRLRKYAEIQHCGSRTWNPKVVSPKTRSEGGEGPSAHPVRSGQAWKAPLRGVEVTWALTVMI